MGVFDIFRLVLILITALVVAMGIGLVLTIFRDPKYFYQEFEEYRRRRRQ